MHFYHLLLWQCFFYEAQHIDCGVAAKSPPAMNECLFLINQDWIWIENYGSLLISILQFCASFRFANSGYSSARPKVS